MSDHLCFVAQFVDQGGDIRRFHPGLADRRLGNLDRRQPRRRVDTQISRLDDIDGLLAPS
jgi:hypothetical protein